MFEEAGAPLPTADWTWDDYIASCLIIKEKTGNYCFNTAEPPTGIDSVSGGVWGACAAVEPGC